MLFIVLPPVILLCSARMFVIIIHDLRTNNNRKYEFFSLTGTLSQVCHNINYKTDLEFIMSDLSSSRCGCDCGCDSNNGAFPLGNGGNSCACSIIWIILLLSLLNNNSDGCGCGNGSGLSNLFGNGNSCSTLIWILLLSSCCGCGSIF
jgi:hypothetical protein